MPGLLAALFVGLTSAAPTGHSHVISYAPGSEWGHRIERRALMPSDTVSHVSLEHYQSNHSTTMLNGQGIGCTQPDPRGYLVYLAFDQQFNNQLVSFAENLLIARQMNRILVLTGFVEQEDAEGAASNGIDYFEPSTVHHQIPFDYIFDSYESLTANGMSFDRPDYISADQFKNLCGGTTGEMKAEAHYFAAEWDDNEEATEFGQYGTTEHWQDGFKIPERLYPWGGPRSGPLPHFAAMSFHSTEIVGHGSKTRVHTYGGDFPLGSEVPVVVIDGLFFKGEQFEPTYTPDGADDVFGIISNMHHAQHW